MSARTTLYRAAQWVWGFPQTLVGAVVFLLAKGESFCFHGAAVKEWSLKGSVSLGMFLFVSRDLDEQTARRVTVHEYGHSVQSLIFGPLYLAVVGLPSVIWAGAPALKKMRHKRNIPYYSVYPENLANTLGERFTGEPADR